MFTSQWLTRKVWPHKRKIFLPCLFHPMGPFAKNQHRRKPCSRYLEVRINLTAINKKLFSQICHGKPHKCINNNALKIEGLKKSGEFHFDEIKAIKTRVDQVEQRWRWRHQCWSTICQRNWLLLQALESRAWWSTKNCYQRKCKESTQTCQCFSSRNPRWKCGKTKRNPHAVLTQVLQSRHVRSREEKKKHVFVFEMTDFFFFFKNHMQWHSLPKIPVGWWHFSFIWKLTFSWHSHGKTKFEVTILSHKWWPGTCFHFGFIFLQLFISMVIIKKNVYFANPKCTNQWS